MTCEHRHKSILLTVEAHMPVLGCQKGEGGVLSRGQSGSLVHIARLGKYESSGRESISLQAGWRPA